MNKKFCHYRQLLYLLIIIIIAAGCASTKSRFRKAASKNTVEAYEAFINNPENKGPLVDKSRKRIEQLLFDNACKEGSIQAFEKYLEIYPEGKHADEARMRVQNIQFFKARGENTIAAFEAFLKKYPSGENADSIKKLYEYSYFRRVSKEDRIEGYESYLKTFPQGQNARKSKSRLAALYQLKMEGENNIEVLRAFIHRFPKNKQVPHIREKIAWLKIKGKTDFSLFDKYLRAYPKGSYFKQALSEADDLFYSQTVKRNRQDGYLDYCRKFPGGKHQEAAKAWLLKKYTQEEQTAFKKAKKDHSSQAYIKFLAKYPSGENSITALNILKSRASAELQSYIDYFHSKDDVKKAYGAYYIGELGSRAPLAVPFLLSQLNNRESLIWLERGKKTSPAQEAAKALVKIGDAAVDPLIQTIKNRDYGTGNAMWALGELRTKKAVPELISALKKNWWKEEAAIALGKIGDKRADRPLMEVLIDKDYRVRESAVEALNQIVPDWRKSKDIQEFLPAIIKSLKSKDIYIGNASAVILGEIGDKKAVVPLLDALSRQERFVKQEAAVSLGRIGDKLAVEGLIAALRDPNKYVKENSARALGEIGDRRAVGPIVQMLKQEKEEQVLIAAVNSLGELKDKRSVKALITLSNHQYQTIKADSILALGKIGDSRAVEPIIKLLKDDDEYCRYRAVLALGLLKDNRAVGPIIHQLFEKEKDLRTDVAISTLKELTAQNHNSPDAWLAWWKKQSGEYQ